MDHRKIETTYQVWKQIKESHPELVVFSSYSAPDGDMFGDPSKCVMMTEYGFKGCDYPIIGSKTTWDNNGELKRENEQHKYWFCVGVDPDEE